MPLWFYYKHWNNSAAHVKTGQSHIIIIVMFQNANVVDRPAGQPNDISTSQPASQPAGQSADAPVHPGLPLPPPSSRRRIETATLQIAERQREGVRDMERVPVAPMHSGIDSLPQLLSVCAGGRWRALEAIQVTGTICNHTAYGDSVRKRPIYIYRV